MTDFFPFKTKWSNAKYFEILEISANYLKNCKKVLDLGCGYGESTYFLEKQGINTTGVEIRQFPTWNHFPKINFKVYDGKKLDFEDNYFDGVLINNVLEHVKNKDAFFNEIKRVCKNNSKAIVVVPNLRWKLINLAKLPIYLVAFIRGYGLGTTYWFVHAKEVYGINYIKECIDFSNWHNIIKKYLEIKNEKKVLNKKDDIFFGYLKKD